MMVASVAGAASASDSNNPQTPSSARPPLLLSEKYNSNGSLNNPRKPKSKSVSSRYMSPPISSPNSSSVSSSRRFHTPPVSRNSRNSPSLNSKRSVSVDRRRPAAVRPLTADLDSRNDSAADISAAAKLLIASTRSLSVSFQGESFSLPVSKPKVYHFSPNSTCVRKGTPEKRKTLTPLAEGKTDISGDQPKNPKPTDHHQWPTRSRAENHLPRNLDGGKLIGLVNRTHKLQQSIADERRISFGGRLSHDSRNSELLEMVGRARDGNSANSEFLVLSYITTSDSDSVSSGCTLGVRGCGGAHGPNGPVGISRSARFWQETNSRLRRLQDLGSKSIVPPKSKRFLNNGMLSSPVSENIRPQSPSKITVSQPRLHGPSCKRNAVNTISNSCREAPLVLSYAVDLRTGKVEKNGILDAHLLRLLYNRHLQWRFVSARAEGVLRVQQHSVKKLLWNAWITISNLRDTVTKKRHRLQLLRRKLKLATILKGQTTFLEEWASLDEEHSISLLGATEALTVATLCLPVVGAIGGIESLQDAIGSAFDVMQTMASSIYYLLPKAEKLNSLASELAKVTTKEEALIERCTHIISSLAAVQDKDSSMRTHIIQLAHL